MVALGMALVGIFFLGPICAVHLCEPFLETASRVDVSTLVAHSWAHFIGQFCNIAHAISLVALFNALLRMHQRGK
ncbi:hypothetical protein CEJ86_32405 [Sinorhizobium meliloti]|uniref:Uncharacterized protein n=1 Tax=Rhizobium meliloti TaxID=382 RepID=A0A2J0YT51_RHIML|nr:hypothetical protein CEJ86_32405 [Sinorhizobium meliloti]